MNKTLTEEVYIVRPSVIIGVVMRSPVKTAWLSVLRASHVFKFEIFSWLRKMKCQHIRFKYVIIKIQ